MKQYKLTEEDMKQIAHFIAQKEYRSDKGINGYLIDYNETIGNLMEYNTKVKEK